MKIRRLKISQQLLIVLFTAVILPLCVTALIITNINQHAVRAELRYSAVITTDSVHHRFEKSLEEKKLALIFIAKSLNYILSKSEVASFIDEIRDFSLKTTNIELIEEDDNINKLNQHQFFQDNTVEIFPDTEKNLILMYIPIKKNQYLKKSIDINEIKEDLFKYLINDKRQVYIIDSNKKIIMDYNGDTELFNKIIPDLPQNAALEEPIIFGKIKNQPNVFLKLQKPDWSIVVVTPKHLITYGIIDARYKIIIAILVAAITILTLGILYSYSLNTNLKQLFRAVSAIGQGNYRRKVHLIKNLFTPSEVVFLASKFNDMAEKVDDSYMELQQANEQLAKIDKLKSNLIDTVSHELRTPLTCIKGYTSRLLRNDINITEEIKLKSLKIIKQQTERLNRLVDDLLVIPEIESSLLRVFPDEVDLKEKFEDCILSIQQKQSRQINLNIQNNFPSVYADPDRVMQIIINLLDNAIKYSPENSIITIGVEQENDFAVIKIKNNCAPIDNEKIKSLFDKFTRLEENLTRTTRGTGLGLFIVRGLTKAMQGEVFLAYNDGFEACFTLPLLKENVTIS